jgi:hypothetical protein
VAPPQQWEQFQQVLTFEQICQWGKGIGNFGQKQAIKVHHAQKLLQILDSVWTRKIKHDLQTVPEWGVASSAEAMAEKVELRHDKLALLQVDGEPIVHQDPEDSPQVFHVLVQVRVCHAAVI